MDVRQNFRSWLRRQDAWCRIREIQRDGAGYWLRRWRQQRKILRTRPVATRPVDPEVGGACEVHILTWDRDCLMALWAAKTFYGFGGVDWPLVWHAGGLLRPRFQALLRSHFPNSLILTADETTRRVEAELSRSGHPRCVQARRRSFMLMKLIDCLVLSRAENLLCIDSDILFFRRPDELLEAGRGPLPLNRFNRDRASHYKLSAEAVRDRYGLELVERLNAGLALFRRESLGLDMLEEFLGDPEILQLPWLTEQTLHALCASRTGVDFLPETYLVSVEPGLETPGGQPLVSKHYTSHPRRYLFEEGIPHLEGMGFLEAMQCPL